MALFGPKKLGLALGSGAARGLAHIGVLRVLEAEGLAPDVITGTSMGAIVGSFYAAGVSLDEMEHLAATTDIKSFVEWKETLLGSGEMLSSRKLEERPSPRSSSTGVSTTCSSSTGRSPSRALEHARVVVSPDVHEVQGLAFANIGDIVAAGERAAAAAVPEIRRVARRRA